MTQKLENMQVPYCNFLLPLENSGLAENSQNFCRKVGRPVRNDCMDSTLNQP